MYRPEFVYPLASAPCQDETCQYSFDSTNCPTFLGTLAPGASTARVPLKLDKDAAFLLRGIRSQGGVSFRLEDPEANGLSDSENVTPSTNYEFPGLYSETAGAGLVSVDSGLDGLYAPAGGNFLAYLYNGTTAPIDLSTCALNLFGVKRYGLEVCS